MPKTLGGSAGGGKKNAELIFQRQIPKFLQPHAHLIPKTPFQQQQQLSQQNQQRDSEEEEEDEEGNLNHHHHHHHHHHAGGVGDNRCELDQLRKEGFLVDVPPSTSHPHLIQDGLKNEATQELKEPSRPETRKRKKTQVAQVGQQPRKKGPAKVTEQERAICTTSKNVKQVKSVTLLSFDDGEDDDHDDDDDYL